MNTAQQAFRFYSLVFAWGEKRYCGVFWEATFAKVFFFLIKKKRR